MDPLTFTIRWDQTDQTRGSHTWRLRARQVLFDTVIAGLRRGDDPETIQQAIDDAYPFDMRRYMPYKVWLEERNVALWILGLSEPTKRNRERLRACYVQNETVDDRQVELPL